MGVWSLDKPQSQNRPLFFSGAAYFGCVQLEKGEVPTSVNLLENSSFEKQNSNGTPSDWTTAGACDIITDKVVSPNAKEGLTKDGSKSIGDKTGDKTGDGSMIDTRKAKHYHPCAVGIGRGTKSNAFGGG